MKQTHYGRADPPFRPALILAHSRNDCDRIT